LAKQTHERIVKQLHVNLEQLADKLRKSELSAVDEVVRHKKIMSSLQDELASYPSLEANSPILESSPSDRLSLEKKNVELTLKLQRLINSNAVTKESHDRVVTELHDKLARMSLSLNSTDALAAEERESHSRIVTDLQATLNDMTLEVEHEAEDMQFAKEQNIPQVDPSYFYTKRRFQSLQRIKEKEKTELDHDGKTAFMDPFIRESKFGTVGCAALDKHGNLAAGTSTGGMTNKRYNRIGDAPIIGAGTYANNATCAVSSTGWGEFFIRAMVAHDISALMEYKGLSLQEAASEVIQKKVPALGGDGGIVAIDKDGNVAMEFNTAGMYRAHMDKNGTLNVKIYKE
jgi:isoaspartyl peptidase/L-asparaginase-like protein (Ntn-hydrolase superfamily)